jgi:hypothetical protein
VTASISIAALFAVLFQLTSAMADEADLWKGTKPGTSKVVKDIKKFPKEFQERLNKGVCSNTSGETPSGLQYTLISLEDFGKYVLKECVTLYGVSMLYGQRGDLVSLAVGSPTEGFHTTAYLGQTVIDAKNKNMKTEFYFDYCAPNVWFPTYYYKFGREGPSLIGATEVSCESGKVRTIWGTKHK